PEQGKNGPSWGEVGPLRGGGREPGSLRLGMAKDKRVRGTWACRFPALGSTAKASRGVARRFGQEDSSGGASAPQQHGELPEARLRCPAVQGTPGDAHASGRFAVGAFLQEGRGGGVYESMKLAAVATQHGRLPRSVPSGHFS